MADHLESAFRTANLEEERQKAQRQGESMFYAFVGATLPSVLANSFSPCASVAIVLVEQLAQFFCCCL